MKTLGICTIQAIVLFYMKTEKLRSREKPRKLKKERPRETKKDFHFQMLMPMILVTFSWTK